MWIKGRKTFESNKEKSGFVFSGFKIALLVSFFLGNAFAPFFFVDQPDCTVKTNKKGLEESFIKKAKSGML